MIQQPRLCHIESIILGYPGKTMESSCKSTQSSSSPFSNPPLGPPWSYHVKVKLPSFSSRHLGLGHLSSNDPKHRPPHCPTWAGKKSHIHNISPHLITSSNAYSNFLDPSNTSNPCDRWRWYIEPHIDNASWSWGKIPLPLIPNHKWGNTPHEASTASRHKQSNAPSASE